MLVSVIKLGAVVARGKGNAADLDDATPDDSAVFALGDACTIIDVPLGDLTVIVVLGDATDAVPLENRSVVCVALDSFTADVTVTVTTMLEDSATQLLPKKCAIERTVLLAVK